MRELRSTNSSIESVCSDTGKIIFLTEREAWVNRKHVTFTPYKCKQCGFWHHTSQKPGGSC
jgi:predicted RNA-binding Zn-ribbon protein involved in translation (DUF1610 family)